MKTLNEKKTMPLALALALILTIAVAGIVAFYLQYEQKNKMVAAVEQSMLEQQKYTMAVYDQIESNLASIREHEGVITQDLSGTENNSQLLPEERIQNEINYIKQLIDENNRLIANLNDQVAQKNTRLASYERQVKELQGRMTKYQEQLDQLVAEKEALKKDLDLTTTDRNNLARQVDQLGTEIVQKNSVIDEQSQLLTDQDKALHTAYYRIGDYKTLRDLNIVEKEGGFLGINRVKTLAEDPDADLFSKIDTREVTRIPIQAKRWEIVTDQDPSTYELEFSDNEAEWLVIKDPDKFWSKSKYLVIVVRDEVSSELASSR